MTSRRFYQIVAACLLLLVVGLVVYQWQRQDSDMQGAAAEISPEQSHNSSAQHPTPLSRRQNEGGLLHREADRLLKAEGAATDASLKEFPRKAYQHQLSPAGKAAGAPDGEAYIHIPSSGRRVAMAANQLGEYPSIETLTSETVGVRLMLDGVKPGTPVRVVILDGGTFPAGKGISQLMEVSDWHGVAFEYTTSANVGTHRVLVEAVGQPKRILDFNAFETTNS